MYFVFVTVSAVWLCQVYVCVRLLVKFCYIYLVHAGCIFACSCVCQSILSMPGESLYFHEFVNAVLSLL